MKKLIVLLLVAVLVMSLAACAKQPQPTQGSEPAQDSKPTENSEPTQATEDTKETAPAENLLERADFGTYDGEIISKVTVLQNLRNDGDFGVAQGACTDGKYIYIILENQKVEAEGGYSKNPHYSKIFKIDPATMETVQVSEPLLIDHGNDITYNSKTGLLVVSHNSPNRKYLSTVDPETLELVETLKDNELDMYAIAYNATKDKYVIGISHGYDFAIADGQLNIEQRFEGKVTNWTKQGVECDDDYIYFLQYNSNAIVVYDWDGNYIRTIRVIWMNNEPEDIFLLDGKFYMTSYIGAKSGAQIFEMRFIGM